MARVWMDLDKRLVSRFAALFTKGVLIRSRTGCSLRDFVCEQLGVPEPYLEQRIQTIFLNGKAVDDYTTARVTDGASLALSAAMPGLVGAVFRRGGYYAGLRNSVTYQSDGAGACVMDGSVTVKLFNLTVKELGPLLLSRGIGVTGQDLLDLLKQSAGDFRAGCRQARLDDRLLDFDSLTTALADLDQVDFQISAASD